MRGIRIESQVHFKRGRRSKKLLQPGQSSTPMPGRVPRVAKLMALALRFEQLVVDGAVADYAELSRLGHVTRARMTQIMNLLHLAPDIQEELLFLPLVTEGNDPIHEKMLRPIAAEVDWERQRRMPSGFVNSR